MSQKPNQLCFSLDKENRDLLKIAEKKYNLSRSKLLNKIIEGWLFSNKLNLIENGKSKRTKR